MAEFVLVAVVVLDACLVADPVDTGSFAVVLGATFVADVVDTGSFDAVLDADLAVDVVAGSFSVDSYPPLQAVVHQLSYFVVWLNVTKNRLQ